MFCKKVKSLKQTLHVHIRRAAFAAKFRSVAPVLADNRFACRWEDRWPCLDDATGMMLIMSIIRLGPRDCWLKYAQKNMWILAHACVLRP